MTAAASLINEPQAPVATAEITGLAEAEAARRLAQYGENALQEKHVSVLVKLFSYFWGPIPWMIEIAAALSGLVRHWADFAIIIVMLLLNAAVGFWQEFKADTAIAALKQRLALRAVKAGTVPTNDRLRLKGRPKGPSLFFHRMR